ncbi:MAG: hypothetical protein KC933_14270 [Myxococcales bacterium]|nr:hypothetical protein [Myxococcales bacterium]MCB9648898.1 hypothetical protein [Deltaproteobacteria bacterium]
MTNTTLRPLGHALLLPLAASLAAGCVAEDHVLGERTETVVSTTGGTALSADGLVRLDFPAGALGEQTLIVIETLRGTGRTGLLSEVYDLRPNGLTFDKPVTIRFEVDSSEPVAIANVDEATPSLLESTYDSVTGRVEAELAHFSSYSVVPAYDPCAGKVCGDACDVCPPNSSCVPPSYATACNPGNQCVRDVPQLCGPAPAALSVFPAALDFGMVQVGASSTLSFKVRNSGGLPGMLTGTSLVPSGAPFTTPSLPSVVPAGGEITASIDFSPVAVEASTATVAITHPDGTLLVHLAGIGTPQPAATSTEAFQQLPPARADILYVVDQSSSMADERQTMIDGAPWIISELDARGIDYHLAVIPTSTHGVDSSLPFVAPATPQAGAALATEFDIDEYDLEYEIAMYRATWTLSRPQNSAFVRTDATLTVVFVSDSDDVETNSVQDYVNAIAAVKNGHTVSDVEVHAVTGGATGCGDAAPAPRFTQAAQLSGGLSTSICGSTWLDTLVAPAGPEYGQRRIFRLSQLASGGGMRVFVNGVEALTPSEWVFDTDANAVVFEPSAIPAPFSSVIVMFQPRP